MGKQFPDVSERYGAPMGRNESPLGETPRGVRVFRVRINAGGYDDGGAYWGIGKPLFCATCPEGGRRFVRADGRLSAIAELQIPADTLASTAGYRRLRELEHAGRLSAGGVILRQKLQELGFK